MSGSGPVRDDRKPVRSVVTESTKKKPRHAKKKGSKRKTLQQSSMRRRPPTERVERCRVVVFVVIVVFWPFLGGWVFRDPARVPVKKASFFFLGFRLWFSFCQFRAEVFFSWLGGKTGCEWSDAGAETRQRRRLVLRKEFQKRKNPEQKAIQPVPTRRQRGRS